jgi:hypothetical protein
LTYGINIYIGIFAHIFGPSGVRALPLAAGINEGGHYYSNDRQLHQFINIKWACLLGLTKKIKKDQARGGGVHDQLRGSHQLLLDAVVLQDHQHLDQWAGIAGQGSAW